MNGVHERGQVARAGPALVCCPVCLGLVPVGAGHGRPAIYCSVSCRRQMERRRRPADRRGPDWSTRPPGTLTAQCRLCGQAIPRNRRYCSARCQRAVRQRYAMVRQAPSDLLQFVRALRQLRQYLASTYRRPPTPDRARRTDRICPICAAPVIGPARGRVPIYCSEACRRRADVARKAHRRASGGR